MIIEQIKKKVELWLMVIVKVKWWYQKCPNIKCNVKCRNEIKKMVSLKL